MEAYLVRWSAAEHAAAEAAEVARAQVVVELDQKHREDQAAWDTAHPEEAARRQMVEDLERQDQQQDDEAKAAPSAKKGHHKSKKVHDPAPGEEVHAEAKDHEHQHAALEQHHFTKGELGALDAAVGGAGAELVLTASAGMGGANIEVGFSEGLAGAWRKGGRGGGQIHKRDPPPPVPRAKHMPQHSTALPAGGAAPPSKGAGAPAAKLPAMGAVGTPSKAAAAHHGGKGHHKKQHHKHATSVLLVVDDIADQQSILHATGNSIPNSIIMRGRHTFLSVWIASQRPNHVSSIIRTQMSALFIYRQRNVKVLITYLDELSAMVDR